MIELKKINGNNINEVIALEVNENQEIFLETSNLKSIGDALQMNLEGTPAVPFAIYKDTRIVGFLMYIYDVLDNEDFQGKEFYGKNTYFIWHFVIDKKFQGLGYGKESLIEIEKLIKTHPNGVADFIVLFFHSKNDRANNLYKLLGYKETGITIDNSIMLIKEIKWCQKCLELRN